MTVHFDNRSQICASQIENYLLEKSRVAFQALNERNFHIFYILVTGADAEMRKRFGLTDVTDYEFLNKSKCYTIDRSPDDMQESEELEKEVTASALQLGFAPCVERDGRVCLCLRWCLCFAASFDVHVSLPFRALYREEWDSVLRIVAGVLHVGNMSFEAIDAESCKVSSASDSSVSFASSLLGVGADALRSALITHTVVVRNERTPTPLNKVKAEDARNGAVLLLCCAAAFNASYVSLPLCIPALRPFTSSALAKNVYGRLFDWLVKRLNMAMKAGITASINIIGVLDIFGFEIFEHNSFEQLCINYCNEKLQQHFNTHVFKEEEKCYKSEEIDYSEVKFVDNQVRVLCISSLCERLLVCICSRVFGCVLGFGVTGRPGLD